MEGISSCFLGCDHAGYKLVQELLFEHRNQLAGYNIIPLESSQLELAQNRNYALSAVLVAKKLQSSADTTRGILICSSGVGMSIAANRFKGIRAALCHSVEAAKLAREHNNANILCLGASMLSLSAASVIVSTFLTTPFEGGRHLERIAIFDNLGE